ncbi:hypothetical protein KC19_VG299400 [Ceratodon purpureus]|uniref:Uncharacterized protein n=1 Tax=Ceratodon purpureus TaxID=3225 RepID=A0A8T0HVS1_CERPU|nr:hypothetical protein KC19_VG299400 [Ceratodon purpureus]
MALLHGNQTAIPELQRAATTSSSNSHVTRSSCPSTTESILSASPRHHNVTFAWQLGAIQPAKVGEARLRASSPSERTCGQTSLEIMGINCRSYKSLLE